MFWCESPRNVLWTTIHHLPFHRHGGEDFVSSNHDIKPWPRPCSEVLISKVCNYLYLNLHCWQRWPLSKMDLDNTGGIVKFQIAVVASGCCEIIRPMWMNKKCDMVNPVCMESPLDWQSCFFIFFFFFFFFFFFLKKTFSFFFLLNK